MSLGEQFSMDFDSHDFLAPDIMMPSQFYQGCGEKRPEAELLVAIFHEAINCVLDKKPYNPHLSRRLEALEWFESTQRDDPARFTFIFICEALGYEPNMWRVWVRKQLTGHSQVEAVALGTILKRRSPHGPRRFRVKASA